MRRPTSRDRLIVALDFAAAAPAVAVAKRLRGLVRTVKVGSALFTACGPAVIRQLRSLGFHVMLDLKFLDIPSTVELSCRCAVHHRVSMLTIHASAEPAMLEAAVHGVRAEAARLGIRRPLVLGVTVLTSVPAPPTRLSLPPGRAALLRGGPGRPQGAKRLTPRVTALAHAALEAGCDGVVASAQEAASLRRRFGRRLRIVCPGIRPAEGRTHDQQRVCTPGEALARGADALVIGRPITAARDPRAVVQRILNEMEAGARC